ncbi:tetratricopeptide repeat protein [Labilithrix luteola]|nr:hypothetical protein [Labilithrix luteola]
MRTRFCLAAVASVLVLATPNFAAAQGPNERAADAAFQEGRTALEKGNLLEACTKLAESDRLAPSGRAVLNLGDCYERRGMVASAYSSFLEAAARAVQANRPDAERHARERASRLEGRLPRVSFVVPKSVSAQGLEVKKDGAVLPPSSWNTPELADPGTSHTYEASAPGKSAFVATVTAEEGKTARVELKWPENNNAVAAVPAAAAPAGNKTARIEPVGTTASDSSSSNGSRTLAYAALGVGAAGVIVGTIGGLQVLSAKSTVDSGCANVNGVKTCNSQSDVDAASSGKTWSVVSPIAFGVGALGLGVGAYLFFHNRAKTEKQAFMLAPSIGQNGAGFAAAGHF